MAKLIQCDRCARQACELVVDPEDEHMDEPPPGWLFVAVDEYGAHHVLDICDQCAAGVRVALGIQSPNEKTKPLAR